MNVLVVSAVLPYPLQSGGQVRLYHLLRELSKNHSIFLLSFIREEEEKKYKKDLPFCKYIELVYRGRAKEPRYLLKAILGQNPWLYATYDNLAMRKLIEESVATYAIDLVHLEPGYVAPSVPTVSVPLVVSEHNIEHKIYQGYKNRFEKVPLLSSVMQRDIEKLKHAEMNVWKRASEIIAVSSDDALFIKKRVSCPVTIVPNGVDLSEFRFVPQKTFQRSFAGLFVGDFRWVQNRDAIEYLIHDIWPVVSQAYQEATLTIVGRELPQVIAENLPPQCRYIPWAEDIHRYYESSHVLLAPIRVGGGTKYKILEAMASGCPIITTEKGVEGLTIHSKNEIFIAQTLEDWVKHIDFLLENGTKRMEMLKRARTEIEKTHSWDVIAKIQDSVWNHVYETSR